MAVIDEAPVQTEMGRPLTDAEKAQVLLWIGDAEALIQARLGDLADLDQAVLAMVVRKAVVAQLRNPKGVTEESRQIDDWKRVTKFNTDVTITDEWWELLAPDTTSGAWTINPTTGRVPDRCPPRSRWSSPGWSMP